jgi:ADP-ribosylglycohydrolase
MLHMHCRCLACSAAAAACLQEAELQAQHAAELDAVHTRLQEVLARKDVTISQLKAELDCTLAQLQQATQELMAED